MPAPASRRSMFDAAAAEYDAARPSYPPALFDELEAVAGPLTGRLVLDWGAGTGISARQLAARGATVVLLDIGEGMLRYARERDPRAPCVLADGQQMPVRAGAADLTTFGQSWHWFVQPAAGAEVARVLRPGGFWAAWWNRARADGQDWFERYQDVLESACPGYHWRHKNDQMLEPDWRPEAITARGRMDPVASVVVPWTRQLTVSQWITEERSKSYFISLAPGAREAALARVAQILGAEFPDGLVAVPYVTTLLTARKAGLPGPAQGTAS
jgi:SAM-dependent methyltransferase